MTVEAQFKRLCTEPGENGARVEILLAQVTGSVVLNWNGKTNGRWVFNVHVHVFPSGKVWVQVVDNDRPTVRPSAGILQGMKITDGTAVKAAVGELGVHWLNQKVYGGRLRLPDISAFARYQEYDSCMNCRWHRRVRMGSDEMDFDFSEEDGRSLREMERPKGCYQPEHLCLLFSVFIEEQFFMMEEINRIMEGGVIGSSLVNLAAGFGVEPVWRRLRDIIDHDIQERACLFHRQSKFQANQDYGVTQVVHTKVQSTMKKRLMSTGPKAKNNWEDIIPIGWLPRYGKGILIPGGIEMSISKIDLTEVQHVQQSLSFRRQQLQSRGKQLPRSVHTGKPTSGSAVNAALDL